MGSILTIVLYAGGALFLLLFALWLAVTVYIYLLHRRYAHIPSPKMPSFYLGHLPVLMKVAKAGGLVVEVFLKWSEECGPLYAFFVIHTCGVVALQPEDVKEVLMSSKVQKPWRIYKNVAEIFGERFLGRGLVTIPKYEEWRPRRSLYDPSFTKSYLKGLIPIFNECVDQFLERLRPLADGKTQVPMKEEFAGVTMDIICKAAFGSDLNSQTWSDESLGLKRTKGKGRLSYLIEHTLDGTQTAFRNPYLNYWNPAKAEGYRETTRAIRKIGRECIQKRIEAIKNGEQVPNDILTHILKITTTEQNADLEDLVDDFATFFVAGQETTAMLLTFTVILLHQNPEVLQRVLEEVSEVLGERQSVTAEDLEKMVYLEQAKGNVKEWRSLEAAELQPRYEGLRTTVFLETLRLYPPASATMREAPEGLILSGYEIPKGTSINIPFYVSHHSREHFTDPEMFDPSRFDPERERPSHFVYHPFSAGHRSCIGKVFAMMEAKMIMSRLLNSFAIHLPSDYVLKVVQKTTIRPADRVPCTLELVDLQ